MVKQVIIIYKESKPVNVCEIKTIQSLDQLDSLKSECAVNKAEYDLAIKQEKENLLNSIQLLSNRIDELEKRIYKAELELKFNRGEITETEYEELCLGIK